jgi:hypothetical protein
MLVGVTQEEQGLLVEALAKAVIITVVLALQVLVVVVPRGIQDVVAMAVLLEL